MNKMQVLPETGSFLLVSNC